MKRKKNQGLTLVELLVSVAVLSIVTLGIGGLLRLAAEQYSNATKETEVQNTLQQAFASVSNSMEDAELGVFFSTNELTVANKQKFIKFELKNGTLYYDEQDYSDPSLDDEDKIDEAVDGSASTGQANILADHVNAFSVSFPPEAEGVAVLTISVKYYERSKSMTQNVFLRNFATMTGLCLPAPMEQQTQVLEVVPVEARLEVRAATWSGTQVVAF